MNINLGVDLNQFEFWIKPRTCRKRDTDSQFIIQVLFVEANLITYQKCESSPEI